MTRRATIELPIAGMDCAECTAHVRQAVAAIPGVHAVEVRLAGEKAIIELDPEQTSVAVIQRAVEAAGYAVPVAATVPMPPAGPSEHTRPILTLLGVVFGAVLFIVVVGEWLGLLEMITRRVPWPIWLAVLSLWGYPIARNVVRAALQRRIIAHTLMLIGALAAVAVGEWATAAVVVFFMRVGEYTERFTTERARRAVKDLTALAPQRARVEREGMEHEEPVAAVQLGDVVIVRPGEQIPVDGEVVGGQATVDQAALTGESMPVEVGPGSSVLAASFARLGHLRVRTTHVGPDTTFGRVIKLVEEAETHRAEVQRIADKFSAYYLPVVVAIALVTFLVRRDPLATAAVLVVACSCSFALATPIALLASVGSAAKRGLLIKGGKYLEALARADVLLLDKTGTLTLGRPQVTDVVPVNGATPEEVLQLAAAVERYSEHPLAEAVRTAARKQDLTLLEPAEFTAVPGAGVEGRVNGSTVIVGNRRLVPAAAALPQAQKLDAEGKTLLFVARDGQPIGILAATDTLRPEVPTALQALRALGLQQIELLTGDNARTAAVLAAALGVAYRAGLLPEDKIAVVKDYQAKGRTVVMVGDGVNDAPALAQANVGIAMGVAGTAIAMESAHVGLLREDWGLIPELFHIAQRTMRVIKGNIAFTAVFNAAGLTLAALGILPPILAAGAQSLPDVWILGNSSRLLRHKKGRRH